MIKPMNNTGWNFDNSYARLPQSLFSLQNPNPVRKPELIIFNGQLAESLGLNSADLKSEEGAAVFAGNTIPEGAEPLAQAYAGHQFGYFTMLGDGRAVMLGEQHTPAGGRYDIQLKGSGRTPYSRGGDGRAALGPMLREYIISEAMHALGIPTTRSLAVVKTGEPVIRETNLPGAILTRVAASHIRVGTFQYAANWCSVEDLKSLADYTISRHYPEIEGNEDKYRIFLKEVIKRQAALIAQWMLTGFIHGVMNTDNMAISGETIDYGPCAFMDTFDPQTVFSSIDTQSRYAYGNQPVIGVWNLSRFAESLLPLLHENEDEAVNLAQDEISRYMELFEQNWQKGMRAKLGLFNQEEGDRALIKNLLDMMQTYRADYTNTFRALTLGTLDMDFFAKPEFMEWHGEWKARLGRQEKEGHDIRQLMQNNNPAVIPRNHRVEEALDAAVLREDFTVMERLLNVLSTPYEYTPDKDEYCQLPSPSPVPYRTFCGT